MSAEHHIRNAASRASQLVAMAERRAESSAFKQWLDGTPSRSSSGNEGRVQDGHDAAGFREMLVDWSNQGRRRTSKAVKFLAE